MQTQKWLTFCSTLYITNEIVIVFLDFLISMAGAYSHFKGAWDQNLSEYQIVNKNIGVVCILMAYLMVLQVKLVRTAPASPEWLASATASHQLYIKYQVAIHGDTASKCTEDQFRRFLVKSPLQVHNKYSYELHSYKKIQARPRAQHLKRYKNAPGHLL